MSTITKEKTISKVDEILSMPYTIWLHNDSYNTFDHVINCMMKVCGHDMEQSTQIAHLVHFKGLCDVKRGELEKLSTMKQKLQNAGLNVTLEKN